MVIKSSIMNTKLVLYGIPTRKELGLQKNPVMRFSLPQIVQSLSYLDEPFTMEEIEAVVKEMPTDRAPGPDGFNGLFMKKMMGDYKRRLY
jgi:hypothetical protein